MDTNWELSANLARDLSSSSWLKVALTKTTLEETVTNRQRAEIGNAASAALMLRIHCDSGRGHGVTLYYPSGPGKLGNDTGPSPAVCSASAALAFRIQESLTHALGARYRVNPVKTDRQTAIGSRQGALTGSIFSRVPIVTIELGYLDNPEDERFLTGSATRRLLSEALAASILEALQPGQRKY